MKASKDTLLWLSIALAITGTIQTQTGFLSALAAEHPTAFGAAMAGISAVTAVLTTLKSFQIERLKEDK